MTSLNRRLKSEINYHNNSAKFRLKVGRREDETHATDHQYPSTSLHPFTRNPIVKKSLVWGKIPPKKYNSQLYKLVVGIRLQAYIMKRARLSPHRNGNSSLSISGKSFQIIKPRWRRQSQMAFSNDTPRRYVDRGRTLVLLFLVCRYIKNNTKSIVAFNFRPVFPFHFYRVIFS